MTEKAQFKIGKWPDHCSSQLIQKRCQEILEHERERHVLLSQCGKCANVLYADFRFDEICLALDKFKSLGLDLDKLFEFQENVNGVVYPWNIEYNTLRQDVNRRFNVFPLVIVMCKTEKDVISAFRFARQYNIEISLRGGAHSVEGFSLINTGMVIDQSRRKEVKIYEEDIIKIEPGVLIGPLMDKISEFELAFPVGSCPNNGQSGFVLGGGLGRLDRQFGAGSDNILEAKILLANGKIIKANKEKHSDLFWALRGAGIGNFGIVLWLKLRVFNLSHVIRFEIEYDFKHIKEVIRRWFEWIKNVSLKITADCMAFNGKGRVLISGYYLKNDEEKLRRILKPIIIGNPKIDIERIPFIEAVKLDAGRGRYLPFFKFKNAFVECSFDEQALNIIEYFMSFGDGNDYFILDDLGGAVNRTPPEATAFVHRGFLAWYHTNTQWADQRMGPIKLSWSNAFYEALQPHLAFQVYQNIPDLEIDEPLERYYGENLPRLIKIKRKYDPENVFHYAQSIPPEL